MQLSPSEGPHNRPHFPGPDDLQMQNTFQNALNKRKLYLQLQQLLKNQTAMRKNAKHIYLIDWMRALSGKQPLDAMNYANIVSI